MNHKQNISTFIFIFLAQFFFVITACDDTVDDVDPVNLEAESIELVSGNSQTAEILSVLKDKLVVRTLDKNGNAIGGIKVLFVPDVDNAETTEVLTDKDGLASYEWKLNETIGTQTLTVKAYKSDGTTELLGSPIQFSATAEAIHLTDVDGNVYKTVVIHSQVWMAEDLRVTHYPDGSEIPNVTADSTWIALSSDNPEDDAYCFYNNNDSTDYGALYTWQAASHKANVGSDEDISTLQGVCPDGWHLPSMKEWDVLINAYGGTGQAGAFLKEAGTQHWERTNDEVTNATGFTALPGGNRREYDAAFVSMRFSGTWWSATENAETRYSNAIYIEDSGINVTEVGLLKSNGFSVRCVRN